MSGVPEGVEVAESKGAGEPRMLTGLEGEDMGVQEGDDGDEETRRGAEVLSVAQHPHLGEWRGHITASDLAVITRQLRGSIALSSNRSECILTLADMQYTS